MTNPVISATEEMLVIQPTLQPVPSTSTVASASRWGFWITRGSLAVLDQGLISGSNFMVGILLARWLMPAQYGSYTLAFSIFLLLSFFHQALVLEPQRVFGSANYPECLQEYLGVLLRIQGALTLVICLALGTSLWIGNLWARPDGLAGAIGGMTIAAPFVLLLWLTRGAFYVQIAPQYAVAGSTAYCAVVLSSLWIVDRLTSMSPFSAFVMMGFGALVSSAVLLHRLEPTLKLRPSCPSWKAVSRQHWEYGRWLLASFALSWIPGNIYYSLMSAFSGMASVGELKALINFTLPVAQTLTALSMCFIPYASRAYQTEGTAALKRLAVKIAWLFVAAAIVYWVPLIWLGAPILRFLYKGHYTQLASLIPWVAAGSIPWNLAAVPTLVLRAVRSSVSIFRVYLASSCIAVLIGVPATWGFGVRGALAAIILSNVSALSIALFLMCRELRTDQVAAS